MRKRREPDSVARVDQLERHLEDARTFRGVDAADVPDMILRTADDERVFLCLHGALLVETGPDATEPPRTDWRGNKTPGPLDNGEFVVTTTRAVFTGAKQVRQWPWSKLVEAEHSQSGPWTSIEIRDRRRTFGVLYDAEHQDEIRFYIDLAIATARGTRDELTQRLVTQLIASGSPVPSSRESEAIHC